MTRAIQPHIITDDSAFSGKIIGGSLAFSRSCNDYLYRTPSVSGNQKRWTWSAWVKCAASHNTQYLFTTDRYSGTNDGHAGIYFKTSGRIETYFDSTSANQYGDVNEFTVNDRTGWNHIVWRVDCNNSNHRIWVNGKEQSVSQDPVNYDYGMNRAGTAHGLATAIWSTGNSADMLMTEVHHVDGTLYEASHFGFFESSTGKWVPKSSEIIKANTTYGTNGYYLPMDGSGAIGEDQSGNNNHWKPNKAHQNSIGMDKATGGLPIFDTNTGGTNIANFHTPRPDPLGAYCVLAIPMVNGTRYQVRDFSAAVRGSGSNKTLTVIGTDVSERHWVHTGVSRYFDGNDYISIPDSSDFTFDGDFCIEMWIKPTNLSGTRRLISSEQSGVNPAFIFRLDGNKFSAYLKASGGQQSYMTSSNYTLNTDEWYHLAMTRESGQFRTFVNGILDQTSTYTHTVDVNSTVEIGRYVTGSEYYIGYMQDVRVYKGVAKYTKSFVPLTISFAHNPGAHTGWITPDTPTGTAAGRIFDNMRFTNGSVCFDGQGNTTTQQSALSIADTDHMDFYFDADFTMECYVFRGIAPATVSGVFGQWVSSGGTDRNVQLYWMPNGTLAADMNRSGTNYRVTSAEIKANYWNHIALVLQGSTLRLYVNGVQVDSITVSGSPNNATKPFFIGAESNSSSQSVYSYSGHISNVRVVKGVAVYPDGTQFTPSSTPLTNITGTVLLCCQSKDSPTAAAVTPNPIQIHSTANTKPCSCNFNPFDKLDNAPQESNYCILNYNDKASNAYVQSGGIDWSCSGDSGIAVGTHSFTSGKYYFETETNNTNRYHVGVLEVDGANGIKNIHRTNDFGVFSNEWGYRIDGYSVNNNGEAQISPHNYTYQRQTQMVAVDADNGKIYFGRDGIWLNGANPEHGENPHYSNLFGRLAPALGRRSGNNAARINFGQSPFRFPPPVGYKTICSANIKPVGIDSKKHFDTLLYTGDGSSNNRVTGLGFKPDLIWIKSRSTNDHHIIQDTVRGNFILYPNLSSTDGATGGGWVKSFNDDGFTTDVNGPINTNGHNYAAWCWKAGGTASSNTDGDITSSVSVNQEAGFSIVTWSGDGNVNSTVGHGLNGRPDFIMLKCRTSAYWWRVYHRYYGNNATSGLFMNEQNSSYSHDNHGGIKAITNTTFGFGTNGTNDLTGVNKSGDTYVAYCWKAVEGHSAFGSYYGSGTELGPYMNVGFEPNLIMRKRISSTGDWVMMDTRRHPENVINNRFIGNTNAAEQGSGNNMEVYANGFREASTDGYTNADGNIYIYCAWGSRSFTTPFGIQNEGRGWG